MNGTSPLPQPDLDIATFQLLRGPHWWIGYGWSGCDRTFDFPDGLRADYGIPQSTCTGAFLVWARFMATPHLRVLTCTEVTPGSGVFTRAWSKANITVDCNTYSSTTEFF